MPLIIITGLPGSGKTHRAQQILADFQSRISLLSSTENAHLPNSLTVQHLPSYHASLDTSTTSFQDVKPSNNPRDLIYNSAREEKIARAEEFSTAKRALSRNNVVIADAPNYIKGFRYQMWCEAKAVGTRSVVVHVAARKDECKIWNDARLKAQSWDTLLETDHETENSKQGPKVGRDVRGELQPESHTAIYGDTVADEIVRGGARSRSSSMGGGSEEDGNDDENDSPRKNAADTMTLKSLYISNNNPEVVRDTNNTINGKTAQTVMGTTQSTTLVPPTTAPSDPPPASSCLPYSPATLESLSMRYEPPSPFTRWDTPLFTVPSSDTHPPYQAIWDAMFPPPIKPTKKITSQIRPGEIAETKTEEVRRHAATVLPKATGAEALQTLESTTADVVKALLVAARASGAADGEGGLLTFSVSDPKTGTDIPVDMEVPLNTMLSQPALQRLRRKYTQIQRGGIAHGQGYVSGRAEIVKGFSRFVEAEWNVE